MHLDGYVDRLIGGGLRWTLDLSAPARSRTESVRRGRRAERHAAPGEMSAGQSGELVAQAPPARPSRPERTQISQLDAAVGRMNIRSAQHAADSGASIDRGESEHSILRDNGNEPPQTVGKSVGDRLRCGDVVVHRARRAFGQRSQALVAVVLSEAEGEEIDAARVADAALRRSRRRRPATACHVCRPWRGRR